jgi:broad specificity phosphatase PhoE
MHGAALTMSAAQAQHAQKAAEAKLQFRGAGLNGSVYNSVNDVDWKSSERCKLIHFVRHGQGYHNLLGDVSRRYGAQFSETGEYEVAIKEQCPYMLPAIQDPPLTSVGREDSQKLRVVATTIAPELLVVSPLRRATETILIGFHAAGMHGTVPIVAHEGCREQLGVFLCDKRSDIADYVEDGRYHRVDFSHIQSDSDTLWQETYRESMLEMAQRAEDLLLWLLRERPEREIVIGTHSAWLMAVFHIVLTLQPSSSILVPNSSNGAQSAAAADKAQIRTPEEEIE